MPFLLPNQQCQSTEGNSTNVINKMHKHVVNVVLYMLLTEKQTIQLS